MAVLEKIGICSCAPGRARGLDDLAHVLHPFCGDAGRPAVRHFVLVVLVRVRLEAVRAQHVLVLVAVVETIDP